MVLLTAFGDADFAVVGIVVGRLGQAFGKAGVWGLVVVLAIGFVIGSIIKSHLDANKAAKSPATK